MHAEGMAGATADMAATVAGMLSEDMRPQAMSGVDTLASVLAVDMVTMLRGWRADRAAMQLAHTIGVAVVTGKAVTGEAITGIRPMDTPGWAITA
jgi:hypothetical protein